MVLSAAVGVRHSLVPSHSLKFIVHGSYSRQYRRNIGGFLRIEINQEIFMSVQLRVFLLRRDPGDGALGGGGEPACPLAGPLALPPPLARPPGTLAGRHSRDPGVFEVGKRERERERRELVTCWKEARYLALPHPGWDREGDLCWAHVRCPEHAELCRQGRSREILLHQEA